MDVCLQVNCVTLTMMYCAICWQVGDHLGDCGSSICSVSSLYEGEALVLVRVKVGIHLCEFH